MQPDNALFDWLENHLLHTDFSDRPDELELLLDPLFQEISPDGQINHRKDVIDWLLRKDASLRWELHDLMSIPLSASLTRVTYRAVSNRRSDHQAYSSPPDNNETDKVHSHEQTKRQGTLHTSIWRYSGEQSQHSNQPESASDNSNPLIVTLNDDPDAAFSPKGWSLVFHQATRIVPR